MITQVCQYLRNWFAVAKYSGDFKVTNGKLTYSDDSVPPFVYGQYYRIVGSIFNDGVHKAGEELLSDENFTGTVWLMAVPDDVIKLAVDIQEWLDKNSTAVNSPYQSESFGGYSYNLKSGQQGSGVSWQDQFANRLAPWRKI